MDGRWLPVARYLHTPGDDCTVLVAADGAALQWCAHQILYDSDVTHPSQIITATLTTIWRVLVWLLVCAFSAHTAAVASIFFFYSWTSWWRLAGCILCQRRVEEIGFRQCALLCKGISHTAWREKEETQSENTLNFMTEEKKKDFYTQFIGGKKSVNKKLLKKMVIYYAWHPELQLW